MFGDNGSEIALVHAVSSLILIMKLSNRMCYQLRRKLLKCIMGLGKNVLLSIFS